MKIESTGYKITDIIEGNSSHLAIPPSGQMIEICLKSSSGARTEYVFAPDEFDALRHAMKLAVDKAAEMRGEPPAPRSTSPFDLMREMMDGWKKVAIENHQALGHRDHIASCCHVFSPGDVRALIDDAEREYATRNATLPPYDASAATA